MVYERIKYTITTIINHWISAYENLSTKRDGIYLSTTTIHKYMNKDLNLSAFVMEKSQVTKAVKNIKSLIIS